MSKSIQVLPLGAGGFIPTEKKETASYLVRIDRTVLLFDAGTGLKNMTKPEVQEFLKDVDCLHILFSHYHHDHTSGFTWLLKLWHKEIKLYLPSYPLIDADGIKTLTELTSPPYFGWSVQKWKNVSVIDEIKDYHFRIDSYDIDVIKQIHAGGGSIGFRVGDFSYITDVEPRDEHVQFIKNSKLVLLDTMHDHADFNNMNVSVDKPANHGYSGGNALIAKNANVEKMGLIHVDPLYESSRIKNLLHETREIFPNAFLVEDLKTIEVNT